MKLIKHKDGGWVFFVPAKLTANGKRKSVFRANYNAAYEAMMRYKRDLREHGKAAITDEERSYISMARQELDGDLALLPEVLRHWKLTGPNAVVKMTLADAVTKYLEFRSQGDLERRTLRDTKSAMHRFSLNRDWQNLHQITAADIRAYLDTKTAGWARKTAFKHLRLFFDFAKQERLVATDPMDAIRPPQVKAQEAQVYRVEDFERVLRTADAQDPDLVPFLALSGFGMLRTGELINRFADKPVLRWEHVMFSEGKVYVPTGVGKKTRRATGNQREFPLNGTLSHWLEPYRGRTGRIVDMSDSEFRARLSAVFKAAGVAKIDNGLHKSAISYYIAKDPTVGVTLTARYAGNSEAISRQHYVAWLTEDAGKAYFAIRRA